MMSHESQPSLSISARDMGRKGATGARLERLGTSAKRLAGEFIGRHFTGKLMDELSAPSKMA
jgi:hypothetical protein